MVVWSRRGRVGSSLAFLILLAGSALFPSQFTFAQQVWSLPSPWSAQDIGNPAIAGRAAFDQGTVTIDAGGAGTRGQSDQFTFVYQQVSGDVDIIARVDSITAASAWSKAGVMIRSSLNANAAHGFALVSAGNGVVFQRRRRDGGSSSNTFGPTGTAPRWVRLVRAGATITAYSSADGAAWAAIGSGTVALGATAYVGLAATSQNTAAATSAVLSQISVVPLGLPSGQKAIDIGAPAVPGSTSYRDGIYSIHAGGADIWGTSDQFHFVYQQVTGDVEVIAHVQSLSHSDQWAKTGVMIRESLDAGSRHAFALVSAGAGYAFQRRIDTGGISQHTAGPAGAAPGWVRLVRTGSSIQAFYSPDGKTWTSMGTDAVPMADAIYVGIATTSHNTSTATDAVDDSLTIKPLGSTSNQPPLVSITAPADGTTFAAGSNISVTAGASDSDGTITRVDFRAGSTSIGSATASPYTVTWSSVPAGTYSMTAVAVDNNGASTASNAISIKVDPAANQPPAVTLTAPANGATFTAPAAIPLTATASDADGTVAKVEFYSGQTLLNTDTAAPYSFTWSSVPAGAYALKAVAYDNAGGIVSSSIVNVTVGAASSSSVIAGYSLDEGTGSIAADSSGNGHDGTISGTTWTGGRFGSALSFTGGGEVNAGTINFSGALTVMAWFQTRSLYSSSCGSMVMKVHDYGFEVCGGRLYGGVGANGAWTGRVSLPLTTADLNTWKHAAMTYDGNTVRMYVDGALINTASGMHTTTSNPLLFGHWIPNAEYWDGLIDEVRLYDRALSQAEIQADMNTSVGGASGNQPPTVTLTAPANGATFTAPATVALSASASDPENGLARVDFYQGTTLLGSDATAPYSFAWSSVAAGTYSVHAVALDTNGATATSATATITVTAAANQLPAITLTSPPNGSTYTAPASVPLSASATDPDGTIAKVEFYAGTTLLNTDTVAPYTFSWSSVAAGTYALKAIAYDNSGASATSATSTITVSQPDSTPPTGIAFTASADHATLVTTYELRVYANGANPQTATPIATSDLGKPAPDANNDITVDRASFFTGLAAGNYVAAVAAIGSGGTSISTGVTFSR